MKPNAQKGKRKPALSEGTRKCNLAKVQTFSKADAAIQYASHKTQTEDFASVLLRFANGAFGSLAVSQVAAGRKNCLRIEIYGSKKSAWWCSEEPEILRFGQRDRANEVAMRAIPAFGDGTNGYMDFPPGDVERITDTFKVALRDVYRHMVRAIKSSLCAQLLKMALGALDRNNGFCFASIYEVEEFQ